MSNVKKFPAKKILDRPKVFMRPCDYGLQSAAQDLVTQLGTIEAYESIK